MFVGIGSKSYEQASLVLVEGIKVDVTAILFFLGWTNKVSLNQSDPDAPVYKRKVYRKGLIFESQVSDRWTHWAKDLVWLQLPKKLFLGWRNLSNFVVWKGIWQNWGDVQLLSLKMDCADTLNFYDSKLEEKVLDTLENISISAVHLYITNRVQLRWINRLNHADSVMSLENYQVNFLPLFYRLATKLIFLGIIEF